MEADTPTNDQFYDLIAVPGGVELVNEDKLSLAWVHLKWTRLPGDYRNPILPSGFVPPQLRMPEQVGTPDLFQLSRYQFVSKRLRQALAQPDSVIQYWPVHLLAGGPEVQAQDHQWMNILACQPAVDLTRSDCEIKEDYNRHTGARFRFVWSYRQMVLRDDLSPTPEIFRVAEDLTTILATDALANRVQRAGCTGIAFIDPATIGDAAHVRRYRTLTGVREEWTGRRADL